MRLIIRVTPNASIDRIEGMGNDAAGRAYLKIRVRAVPEKGKANAAVEKLIARTLDLPKSAVSVLGAGKTRLKTLEIDGDAETASRIEELMSDDGNTY